jgi:glutaredoxin
MFAWFRSWWPRRKAGRLADWQVVLYTRAGCCLCDRAWEQLRQAQARHGFALDAIDIDTDLALVAEHGQHVPVVAINGQVRFRGIVNEVLLRRLLEAGSARKG